MRVTAVLPVLVLLLLTACGEPADRCAAPSRAEIEAMQAGPMLPPGVVAMRDRWIRASLAWVAEALAEFPPDTAREPVRRLALAALDDPLHLADAPGIAAVADFFLYQLDRALAGIEGPAPTGGAEIWKLYNHGFVVRTAGHCYGFDIFPGAGEVAMTQPLMARLADALEVLFISHRHGDHASREFASLMLQRRKIVVVHPEIWSDDPPGDGELIRIDGGRSERAGKISFTVFPGHQGDIPNNVYLVMADGVGVMHTGDQHSRLDLDGWIADFPDSLNVDILLPNCWTLDIRRMVESIAPEVVVTGHENELGHTVDHRESYAKSYRQLEGLSRPYVMMTWGEKYSYRP
ncbi:MAG: MBL fold metallo-hydrolase [Candidatus Glassbacteria bacterium]|nr:MBL fold metallo-hydrolase [Candidatus Glassbacteria bacterium]